MGSFYRCHPVLNSSSLRGNLSPNAKRSMDCIILRSSDPENIPVFHNFLGKSVLRPGAVGHSYSQANYSLCWLFSVFSLILLGFSVGILSFLFSYGFWKFMVPWFCMLQVLLLLPFSANPVPETKLLTPQYSTMLDALSFSFSSFNDHFMIIILSKNIYLYFVSRTHVS